MTKNANIAKEMKRIIVVILITCFYSCDPRADYYYYVKNNCEEEICIVMTDYNNRTSRVNLSAKSEDFIYHDLLINKVKYDRIEYTFDSFIVTKGEDTSKINYLKKELWKIELISDYFLEGYLIINPEDFEREE